MYYKAFLFHNIEREVCSLKIYKFKLFKKVNNFQKNKFCSVLKKSSYKFIRESIIEIRQ